jgi:hypothetical protein
VRVRIFPREHRNCIPEVHTKAGAMTHLWRHCDLNVAVRPDPHFFLSGVSEVIYSAGTLSQCFRLPLAGDVLAAGISKCTALSTLRFDLTPKPVELGEALVAMLAALGSHLITLQLLCNAAYCRHDAGKAFACIAMPAMTQLRRLEMMIIGNVLVRDAVSVSARGTGCCLRHIQVEHKYELKWFCASCRNCCSKQIRCKLRGGKVTTLCVPLRRQSQDRYVSLFNVVCNDDW